MAPRPLSADLAVEEVLKVINDRIGNPAKKITIPFPVYCPICRQRGKAQVCMNRKKRDETNYGRILSVCYNDVHKNNREKITWLTDKLHEDDRWALQQSMEEAIPSWSSSPAHNDAPHRRARSALDASGRRYRSCIACGGGRSAQACGKGGWCKECCRKPRTCEQWGVSVGCDYHGRPEEVQQDWEREEREEVQRGWGRGGLEAAERPGGGEGRTAAAALPPTQAFHGPSQLRADEARKKAQKEAHERTEELARLFDLVLFTKTQKLTYKVPAQSSDLGALATRLFNWPKRVLDVVFAEVGDEADEIFIFEPASQSWSSYDSTTYRTVGRGERLLCRLPGVGLDAPGLKAEMSDLPMPLRDARRGAKRPHTPLLPTPLASAPLPPSPIASPLSAAASGRSGQNLNLPVPRTPLRRRVQSALVEPVDLDLSRRSPEEIDLASDNPLQTLPPCTPVRSSPRPGVLALLDAVMSSPPPSPSLPPSSPPIPIAEILNDEWPGSRSFGTICNAIKMIKHTMLKEKKVFSVAFREFYGFDKAPGSYRQHAGYLNNPMLKGLVDEYTEKPHAPWMEFSRKARQIVTESSKLKKTRQLRTR
ncbi:hypothetical protein CALCODRAFT_506858 [Calocera cornea HHB12733]|uniref:Uncharacterized protein n=1 Tax=Calocera cornea HHB12733 TaxID=1353952 RepID=A0A165ID15_9BASI|nr:hypothetical protein CALCODRAFT_506858 [Calocera cornea HHB12733]